MFKRNKEEKEEREVRPKYRRIPPGKKRERSVISVSRDLHEVLKVYALKNYLTLWEATDKIITEGIKKVYNIEDVQDI